MTWTHDSFTIKIECNECDWCWEGWDPVDAEGAIHGHEKATHPLVVSDPDYPADFDELLERIRDMNNGKSND